MSKTNKTKTVKTKKGGLAVKILAPLILVTILFGCSAGLTLLSSFQLRNDFQDLNNRVFQIVTISQDLKYDFLKTGEIFTTASAMQDESWFAEAEKVKTRFQENIEKMKVLDKKNAENWGQIGTSYDGYYSLATSMAKAYITDGSTAGNIAKTAVDTKTEEATALITEQTQISMDLMGDKLDSAQSKMANMALTAIVTTLLVVAAIISVFYIVIRHVLKPMRRVTKAIHDLGNRDLTVDELKVNSKDEIGELTNAYNMLRDSLRTIMETLNLSTNNMDQSTTQMSERSELIARSIQDITDAISNIATNASEQASDVERAAEQMAELQVVVDKSELASNNLATASDEISKASEEGTVVVNDLYQVTMESEKAFTTIIDSIEQINISTGKIGEASNMIESIASQTNLLSLNASIEAARAGEMGKGFAVVADEIRKLSEESASCVNEINEMLKELRYNVENANSQSDYVKEAVEKQVSGVKDTQDKYHAIAASIEKINDEIKQLGEIGKIMGENCVGVSDVITNLSAAAQENAASTEETNASAEEVLAMIQEIENGSGEIKVLSDDLQEKVSVYKLQ